MNYTNIRIASQTYTIFTMSPLTTTRIMRIGDITELPDDNTGTLPAMAKSIAWAVVGTRGLFCRIQRWRLYRRIMKKATIEEIFDCYRRVVEMIPYADIATVKSVMEQLSVSISKDNE